MILYLLTISFCLAIILFSWLYRQLLYNVSFVYLVQ